MDKNMKLNEVENVSNIVGDFWHKMSIITQSFKKANDYDNFKLAFSDEMVLCECFTKLKKLYLFNHTDDLELSSELLDLVKQAFEIATRRCLTFPEDDEEKLEEDTVFTKLTIYQKGILYKALVSLECELVCGFHSHELIEDVVALEKIFEPYGKWFYRLLL